MKKSEIRKIIIQEIVDFIMDRCSSIDGLETIEVETSYIGEVIDIYFKAYSNLGMREDVTDFFKRNGWTIIESRGRA